MIAVLARLVHIVWLGHHQKPWCIDLDGNPVGCMTCRKARIMRAIKGEPRRVPPSGF